MPKFNDYEYQMKRREELGNPRLDPHEGEHLIGGKATDCMVCEQRFKKVEDQWLI